MKNQKGGSPDQRGFRTDISERAREGYLNITQISVGGAPKQSSDIRGVPYNRTQERQRGTQKIRLKLSLTRTINYDK